MKPTFSIAVIISCLALCMITGGCGKKEEPMNTQELQDFDKLWNYDDPAATRAEFEKLLPQAEKSGNQSYYLQLQTQIARTLGLETKFDEAHALLDTVEKNLIDDLPVARIRYLLERGRTFRSSDKVENSRPLFGEAFTLAKDINEDFYAIDAAHMMALAVEGSDEKRKWNLTAVDIAENSTDKRAHSWLGSLYNNMGWDYHDGGQYEKALDMFEKALKFRQEQGKQQGINIAEWCVARTLRSMGRNDEAFEMQQKLLERHNQAGTKDGYVYEELGELYLLKNQQDDAEKYFALAYEELSKDVWMARNETERLERLKNLGKVE
jgi:tetratricopeptide (TPR) repeat protein